MTLRTVPRSCLRGLALFVIFGPRAAFAIDACDSLALSPSVAEHNPPAQRTSPGNLPCSELGRLSKAHSLPAARETTGGRAAS